MASAPSTVDWIVPVRTGESLPLPKTIPLGSPALRTSRMAFFCRDDANLA
jgi:hypothetical protein